MIAMLKRLWQRVLSYVGGRTLGSCLVAFCFFLADYYDVLPIAQWLEALFGEKKAAVIGMILPMFFAYLRWKSTDAVAFGSAYVERKAVESGEPF